MQQGNKAQDEKGTLLQSGVAVANILVFVFVFVAGAGVVVV